MPWGNGEVLVAKYKHPKVNQHSRRGVEQLFRLSQDKEVFANGQPPVKE